MKWIGKMLAGKEVSQGQGQAGAFYNLRITSAMLYQLSYLDTNFGCTMLGMWLEGRVRIIQFVDHWTSNLKVTGSYPAPALSFHLQPSFWKILWKHYPHVEEALVTSLLLCGLCCSFGNAGRFTRLLWFYVKGHVSFVYTKTKSLSIPMVQAFLHIICLAHLTSSRTFFTQSRWCRKEVLHYFN